MEDIESMQPAVFALMREAGKMMLEAKNEDIEKLVSHKEGKNNLVTEVDKAVQELLKKGLKEIFPEAIFVGEENHEQHDVSKGYAWIVDPIDGTTNFIKGMDRSAVSIGLTENGQPIAGFIYNPYKDEMYHAIKGKGAYCNEKKIHVSSDPIANGIVTVGTSPYNEELKGTSLNLISRYLGNCLDIRRLGSAALDLVDVAAGRTVLYEEPLVQSWDIAAGSLIVIEAGGKATDMDDKPLQYQTHTSIKAWNGVDE